MSRKDTAIIAGVSCGAFLFLIDFAVMAIEGIFEGDVFSLIFHSIDAALAGFIMGALLGLFFFSINKSGTK